MRPDSVENRSSDDRGPDADEDKSRAKKTSSMVAVSIRNLNNNGRDISGAKIVSDLEDAYEYLS